MKLYYEDFERGQRFTSESRTVSNEDVLNFAKLTGDFNKLHFDREVATSAGFDGIVAHGLLTLSIGVGLWNSLGFTNETILAFAGMDKVLFKVPVYPGDQIRIACEVLDKRELASRKNAGLLRIRLNVMNSKESVLEADLLLIIRKKILN